MEPRGGAPEALTSRLRLLAACVLVLGLALVQDPGFLVPDTKFDLVEAPIDFLGRALHLWDAEGAFGQLQNQAYGYLWPMGSFFAVGWLAQLPAWLVQRLWIGLVMVVALTGTVKVARALGVRSDLAALTAGLAFTLSPRMLTTLGPISIEAWPSAVAPWVLLALIHGSRTGSPRRWAALAGLAVGVVGGVNAAATFAVIPLGVIWVLTRTPGPRRRALMLWWPLCTLLATLWWLVPLLVMGSYSPPFLDFIETTTVTTFPTTLFDVLRGTSDWVPYIDASSRAGNDLITTPHLILNSGVVLMVGVAGLADRRTPERAFLALSVLTGVLLVAAGHSGAVEGWFSEDVRTLLDGALSPLRNVHKFDVVLRLPLVLGIAFVLDRVRLRSPAADVGQHDVGSTQSVAVAPTTAVVRQGNQLVVVLMVLLTVAGSMLPALVGRLTPAGAMINVPGYWQDTATWLGEHDAGGGTALLVPGAPFADYAWGAPRDEPLQFYADSPWAVRNVIPLVPPGGIRMLDEIERRLAQGDGSPGFADYLRRAGVHYLVVRNDLRLTDDIPLPVVVHETLAESDLQRVASFGPDIGGGATLDEKGSRVVVNGGWQASYPAVEVFEVRGDTGRSVSTGVPTVVVGGPEDLDELAELGVISDAPTRLATDLGDAEQPDAPLVLTDGLRARERFFPRIHDGYSPTIAPGDVRRSGNPARDYLIDSGDRWSTVARYVGARAISASSSGADSDAPGGAQRGELPYAAVDGTRRTEWVSGLGQSDAWWQIDLDDPLATDRVGVTGGDTAAENQELRVVTDAGSSDPVEVGPGQTVQVPVPAGATRTIRIEDATGAAERQVAVAEVTVPGLAVQRELVTPVLPDSWPDPDAIVLRADRDARSGCLEIENAVRCVEDRVQAGEEGRTMMRVVTLPLAATWTPVLLVAPVAGRSLDKLIQRGQPFRVSASSEAVPDPRASAVAAVDGDPGTSWLASTEDLRPTLSMSWLGERPISGISLELDESTSARLPTSVRLTWPGGTRDVDLVDGRADFPTIRTDQLTLRVERAEDTTDLGFDARPRRIGIGIGELELAGLPYLPLGLSEDARPSGCGVGPKLQVGGATYSTFVDAAPAALLRGESVPALLCDATAARPRAEQVDVLPLAQGENVVAVRSSRVFTTDSFVLSRTGGRLDAEEPAPAVESGDALSRRILPRDGDRVLALRQNENAGWVARQDGERLTPLVLDGWQQGFELAGDGQVSADFAPDRTYRVGLGLGLLGMVALVASLFVDLLLGRRRSVPEALDGRLLPAWLIVPAALAGSALIAGTVGVVLAAAVLAGLWVVGRRWPDSWTQATPWLLGVPCFAVSVWYAIRPWADQTGWAGQDSWTAYVMLVPVVGVLVAAARPRRSQKPLSRRVGSSTKR